MSFSRNLGLFVVAAAVVSLTACSSSDVESSSPTTGGTGFPITVDHAFGSTTIASADRIATVGWANQEVPLALGVVPVGMAKATWGDDDGDGILPWVEEKLTELDAPTPAVYDETDGPDYEAVAATEPDVILAAYSGLTREQYDKLAKIAPVVAYPTTPWGTTWDDTIAVNAEAVGRKDDGAKLIENLTRQIDAAVAARPDLRNAKTLFAYLDPTDMSQIGYYTLNDPRAEFLKSAGLPVPAVVETASTSSPEFFQQVSAERADDFADVDLIVTYGDDKTLAQLRADPLLGKIPAIAGGRVAILQNETPLAAASNPTALSIPSNITAYFDLLAAGLKQS